MVHKLKHNKLRKGLKLKKQLETGFYNFIYEKHIDWAIILGVFLVMLPYVASTHWLFLTIKLIIFIVVIYMMGRYLLTWNQLYQLYKMEEKMKKAVKKLVNPDKTEQVSTVLDELSEEIQKLSKKVKKEDIKYYSFDDYLKNEPEDFKQILDVLNKDIEASRTSLGVSLAGLYTVLQLRELPPVQFRNYRIILAIILMSILFFMVYWFEIWLGR